VKETKKKPNSGLKKKKSEISNEQTELSSSAKQHFYKAQIGLAHPTAAKA